MKGISLSVHHFPTDYPRGIKLELSNDCSNYKEVYQNPKWTGSINYHKNTLPYYTTPNIVNIFFKPQEVQCFKIRQIAKTPHFEWRVSELKYLPAINLKKRINKLAITETSY